MRCTQLLPQESCILYILALVLLAVAATQLLYDGIVYTVGKQGACLSATGQLVHRQHHDRALAHLSVAHDQTDGFRLRCILLRLDALPLIQQAVLQQCIVFHFLHLLFKQAILLQQTAGNDIEHQILGQDLLGNAQRQRIRRDQRADMCGAGMNGCSVRTLARIIGFRRNGCRQLFLHYPDQCCALVGLIDAGCCQLLIMIAEQLLDACDVLSTAAELLTVFEIALLNGDGHVSVADLFLGSRAVLDLDQHDLVHITALAEHLKDLRFALAIDRTCLCPARVNLLTCLLQFGIGADQRIVGVERIKVADHMNTIGLVLMIDAAATNTVLLAVLVAAPFVADCLLDVGVIDDGFNVGGVIQLALVDHAAVKRTDASGNGDVIIIRSKSDEGIGHVDNVAELFQKFYGVDVHGVNVDLVNGILEVGQIILFQQLGAHQIQLFLCLRIGIEGMDGDAVSVHLTEPNQRFEHLKPVATETDDHGSDRSVLSVAEQTNAVLLQVIVDQ